MKNLWRIFRYIDIPKLKLAFYISCSVLAALFAAASLGMLSPFLQLLIGGDHPQPIDSKAAGPVTDYIQQLRDNEGPLYALGAVCIIIVIMNIISNVFRYLSYYVSTPVRNNVLASFRLQLYDKILKLPVNYFTDQRKGDLMSRMIGDIGEIQSSVVSAMEGLIKDPLTILVYLGLR